MRHLDYSEGFEFLSLCSWCCFNLYSPSHLTGGLFHLFSFQSFLLLQFETSERVQFPTCLYSCFELACWATWETRGHLATLCMTSHPDNSALETQNTRSTKLHVLSTKVSMAAVSCCLLSPFPALHCWITMTMQHVFSQFCMT